MSTRRKKALESSGGILAMIGDPERIMKEGRMAKRTGTNEVAGESPDDDDEKKATSAGYY